MIKFSAFAGTIGAAIIAGTMMTGPAMATEISDTAAAPGGSAFLQDHFIKRYTSEKFQPRDSAVTITGSVDLGNTADNGAILIGLIDADLYDNSSNPDFATYQSGAYAYFSPGPTIAAPSDGNAGGGELLTNRLRLGNATNVDFSLTIAPDGTLTLTANNETTSVAYGNVKIRPDLEAAGFGSSYAADEFANGAYLSVDFAAGGEDSTADYTINTPTASDVPEPSVIVLMGLGLALILGGARRRRSIG